MAAVCVRRGEPGQDEVSSLRTPRTSNDTALSFTAERTLTPVIQYAMTDRQFFLGDERHRRHLLVTQAHQLAAANVDFLQIREKDLSPPDLLALASALRSVLPLGSGPRLLVNTDLTVALAVPADGLHLPGGRSPADLSAALAAARHAFRNAGRPDPTLSVSAHSVDDVLAARNAGADLILFGPIFEKRVRGTLVQPGIGLAALTAAARAAHPTPVLALGGITPATIPACLAAGASGIAAIRLFLQADSFAQVDPPDEART